MIAAQVDKPGVPRANPHPTAVIGVTRPARLAAAGLVNPEHPQRRRLPHSKAYEPPVRLVSNPEHHPRSTTTRTGKLRNLRQVRTLNSGEPFNYDSRYKRMYSNNPGYKHLLDHFRVSRRMTTHGRNTEATNADNHEYKKPTDPLRRRGITVTTKHCGDRNG